MHKQAIIDEQTLCDRLMRGVDAGLQGPSAHVTHQQRPGAQHLGATVMGSASWVAGWKLILPEDAEEVGSWMTCTCGAV